MPLPRVAQATVLADASHFCNNVALTETKHVLVLSKQFAINSIYKNFGTLRVST